MTTRNLRFSYFPAIDAGEKRHAVAVMKELGIDYVASTPQSVADQWWFWGCKNVPTEMPAYLTVLDVSPKPWLTPLELAQLAMASRVSLVNTPNDAQEPHWEREDRVHNWRNHVSDEIEALWPTFTPEQRAALARQAQELADAERWD